MKFVFDYISESCVNSFSIKMSTRQHPFKEAAAIHPFAGTSLMLCRHQFKTTALFHQNIGVGKAKQRRCFKVGTSEAFLEEFVNVNRQTKHQVDAIRHGTIEIVVSGFVVQEVVCCEGESDGCAEALDGRELPQRVGRVVDGAGAF